MDLSTQRKTMIAVAVAGMLAAAVTLLTDGTHSPAPPGAAGTSGVVRAQRVDVDGTPDKTATGFLGHKTLDLVVQNSNSYHVRVCVDNSAVGAVCTPEIGVGLSQKAEMDRVDINPADDVAEVTAGSRTISVPVHMASIDTYCFRFKTNSVTSGTLVSSYAGNDFTRDAHCSNIDL